MTDATFQQLQGYYQNFSNLPAYNIRQGIALDKKAFQKAAHCMLASDWCKRSAMLDYGIDTKKISVVPCGANLDQVPTADIVATKQNENCQIVFLGVDWERKGGAIALEAFRLFRKENSTATMWIIGCVPPVEIGPEEGIEVIPFLDKNKAAEMERLHQILLETDFLLLPTRAECAGIVFCEAAAYGIPSISTNTGGVATYVRDGINGYALPVEAGESEYANMMNSIWKDQQEYVRLKQQSRVLFEQELNWDAWGNAFKKIADRLIRK
jgi:glycosyltransferase involved in cell wall biosynthesis